MGEHVLVVGGGRELPGLLRARREGVRTSVVCQLSLLPRLACAAEHERVLALRSDAADDVWIDTAATVHRADPVTRIATFGERDQMRAAVIGAALGVATHDPATVMAVHDKRVMRRVLAAAGVEEVRSAVVTRPEELARWLREHGGTWVVKPLDGSGSAGVSVVDDPAGARAAYERSVGAAHTGRAGAQEILVEEYLRGPQVSVEAVSEDGEHVAVAVTRKHSDAATLVELGHVVPAGPVAGSDIVAAAHVVRVLEAIGVGSGVTHTELVLTDDGPRVIETHLRLAGDEIPYLVRDATGVDMVDVLVRQTLGERVLPGVRATLAATSDRSAQAIWYGVAPCAGTLLRVEGAEGSVVREIADGATVTELRDSGSRPLFARAEGPDPDTALARARAAVARCTLVVGVSPDPDLELL